MDIVRGSEKGTRTQRGDVRVIVVPHSFRSGDEIANDARAGGGSVADPHLPPVNPVVGDKQRAVAKRGEAGRAEGRVERRSWAWTDLSHLMRAGVAAVADPQLPVRARGQPFEKE